LLKTEAESVERGEMEDDTQVIGAELLDESLRNFRALCFEQVRICWENYRPELRGRALMATEAAFVDCLAALWA
jgi:hypothetical protein